MPGFLGGGTWEPGPPLRVAGGSFQDRLCRAACQQWHPRGESRALPATTCLSSPSFRPTRGSGAELDGVPGISVPQEDTASGSAWCLRPKK